MGIRMTSPSTAETPHTINQFSTWASGNLAYWLQFWQLKIILKYLLLPFFIWIIVHHGISCTVNLIVIVIIFTFHWNYTKHEEQKHTSCDSQLQIFLLKFLVCIFLSTYLNSEDTIHLLDESSPNCFVTECFHNCFLIWKL